MVEVVSDLVQQAIVHVVPEQFPVRLLEEKIAL